MEIKTPSDEIGTGNLFVVKQFIMIDNNTQRMLGIEPREGTFTLASSTSVGWPKK